MRLFLSSQSLGDYPDRFKELVGKNKKLALCENAKDDESDTERKIKHKEHKEEFTKQGYEVEELDLRDFFGKKDELEEWLSDFGAVWVSGGNTFILRRAMAASGFDRIIKNRLGEDSIAYGGSSAGSCVAAKSLHGIEFGDRPEPDVVPKNYPDKKIIWEGLGFIDFMVVPHYQSRWWGEHADEAVQYLKKHNLKHHILKDGQVILINGDKVEFLK
jgi:dipeptidase E